MTNYLTRLLTAVVGTGVLTWAVAAADKNAPPVDKGDTTVGLTGVYTIFKGEQSGQPLLDEKFKGSVILFTGDEVIGTDKDKKQIFVAKYKLDTTKTPWVINMKSTVPNEGEATGLIEKRDGVVKIIYNLPGGDVPTEFKTHAKQNMFWMKAGKGAKSDDKPSK
ncbi:hypothetical protein [Fimbriiglobus ruber]|uniref:Uncharacterized protein n=1 Tax=Fimbriiglobus ruber TaxID=1908690 RepID=A0A225D394_9BACT|nr:hypothetical protein [Fimbriiglobus ruber]OWK36061.1 hypothetical protein FRUB_08624 [Fimbriiglobus ruber]